MIESPNIQIPLPLFTEIIGLMEYLNLNEHNFPSILRFNHILVELREKQNNINKHTIFGTMLRAKDEEQRNAARRDYLKLKTKIF